jgi:hypothetical protein
MKLHKRVKNLDFWDIKMSGIAGVIVGIILARYRLELLDISIWWWLTLLTLVILRPIYHFWIKGVEK